MTKNIGKPVFEIDEDHRKITIKLFKEYYHRDAVLKTAHQFVETCGAVVAPAGDYHVEVTLHLKNDMKDSLLDIAHDFSNQVLDQQIREDLNRQNGKLREIIYQHAFNPIKDLENAVK